VTPFTGQEVKGQDNKVTNQNSFSFAARPSAGGVTYDMSQYVPTCGGHCVGQALQLVVLV